MDSIYDRDDLQIRLLWNLRGEKEGRALSGLRHRALAELHKHSVFVTQISGKTNSCLDTRTS